MATFRQYETKEGKRWLFKATLGTDPLTGKRKQVTRQGFRTKAEANKAAMKMELSFSEGAYISNENTTFQEVFEQWYSTHSKTVKVTTQKSIKSKFDKHILPRFGKLKMKDITKIYCQQQINEIAKQIKSVNDIKIQANQVFKYAVKMDILARNPLEYVSIPKQEKDLLNQENEDEERNYWTKDEIKRFLSICKEELALRDYVLFHCLIYTGARKGEILALTWDDIDFNKSTIRLNKTLAFHNNGHIVQTSKTKASKRLISIDDKTLALLKKYRLTQKKENLEACLYLPQKNNNVFTRNDNAPMRLAYPNEKLNILINKHSLHHITIHGLRHSHASLLFEAGASIKEVQERLGHSDIKMTMNIYTHVTDTMKEQTAQKFQKFMEL